MHQSCQYDPCHTIQQLSLLSVPSMSCVKLSGVPSKYFALFIVEAATVIFQRFLLPFSIPTGFYLCQVLHYVYDDSVGPIQIQWMEKKANNIYELDYMDTVDRESVLTEVRLNPGGERGLKTLPAAEKERIDKILGFSLQKEKGLLHGVDSKFK